ncbi:MAG: PHP domain-containing protein, partial [Streptosporangiaceae bacterium]
GPSRGVPGGSSPRGQHSLHLLAYLFDPGQPELAEQTKRIRDDRVLRARAMVARLADLGVDITWEQVAAIAGSAVIGRPHLARAMVASGAITEPSEAFSRDWIGEGGRAYVDRYALDPVRAIRLVRAAGGVAVVAHPRAGRDYHVTDDQIAMLAAAGLAGVEVFHPDQPESRRPGLLALTRALGLVATGGSDDHGRLTGHRIGVQTTPAEAYEQLVSQAADRPLCRVLFSNGHHVAAHQERPYCLPRGPGSGRAVRAAQLAGLHRHLRRGPGHHPQHQGRQGPVRQHERRR